MPNKQVRSKLKPRKAQPPPATADWDQYREYLLWAPHVIKHDGTYYMYVCVGDKDSHNYPIHLLMSEDLKTWTRSPDNPMVVDGFDGRDPMVLRVGDEWVMYYTATSVPEGGNRTVNCVTSKDLVNWSNQQTVFTHPQVGTFGGPTESPFVVRRGENFYLFICDNDWINVFVSHDPFQWDNGNQVGRIHAHACEVVRDTDGKWYITHAGWMSGPVEIAPLQWNDGLDDAPASVQPAE